MNDYDAAQGGHAPSHLRGAFGEWVDNEGLVLYQTNNEGQPYYVDDDGDTHLLFEVIENLRNCTDILASDACVALEIPLGSTYAHAIEVAREALEVGAHKFSDLDRD